MQKGTVQLLLILATAIIILGGVYFYQGTKRNNLPQISRLTSSAEVKFNDYSNTNLEFAFKYAKDLIAKVDSEENFNKRGNGDFRKNFTGYVGYEPGKVLGAVVVLSKDQNYDTNPFSVWVFDNTDNLTIDSWFNKYWYYPYLWGVFDWVSKGHVTPDTEATISGRLAKSKIVSYQPGKPKFVYISNDNKMYLFRMIGESGDKILSTFSFLNQTNQTDQTGQDNACKITGCNREICSDKMVVSPCVALPKYECYRKAVCQRQADGKCGWTKTAESNKCLEKY